MPEEKENVTATKQPTVPEGVEFPVWPKRADGRSSCAENPKELADLMRAGYQLGTPEPPPAAKPAKKTKAKPKITKKKRRAKK